MNDLKEKILAKVRNDLEEIEAALAENLNPNLELVSQAAGHILFSGGKRLRPLLMVLCARICGYNGDYDKRFSTIFEYLHTATLLHDDVVDDSDMRRGKASARMVWGNQASVLVGDFLLGQAFKMMVEVGSLDCLRILSNAASVIAEGEVMQLTTAKNVETTEDEYLAVIRAKTAALFSAAAEVGPVIAGAGKSEEAAFRSYGMNLGLAFQLIDDALDYGGNSQSLGKSVGDDFREGKVTLPVVLAYRRGTNENRAFWKRCLEKGDIGDGDLDNAITLMREHRTIEDSVERARHYGAIARDALAPIKASPQKDALLHLVDFCIQRAY